MKGGKKRQCESTQKGLLLNSGGHALPAEPAISS